MIHSLLGNDESPLQIKMKTVEDVNGKPKDEIPPTSEFSLITPKSEQTNITTPLGQEPAETTSKVINNYCSCYKCFFTCTCMFFFISCTLHEDTTVHVQYNCFQFVHYWN